MDCITKIEESQQLQTNCYLHIDYKAELQLKNHLGVFDKQRNVNIFERKKGFVKIIYFLIIVYLCAFVKKSSGGL